MFPLSMVLASIDGWRFVFLVSLVMFASFSDLHYMGSLVIFASQWSILFLVYIVWVPWRYLSLYRLLSLGLYRNAFKVASASSLAITMFELHGVLVDIINYLWLMSGRPLSFCNGIKKDHNFSRAKSPHETIKRIYYVCNQTGYKATSISTRAHFAYKSIVSKLFISLDAYIEGL